MTFRAILIGLLGATFIGATAYINDLYMLSSLMVGHNFPLSVFGGLVVVTLLINPVLFLIKPSFRLTSGELAVITALILAGCGLATGGMMRFFSTNLIVPVRIYQNDISWRKAKVMEYLPPGIIPGDGKYDQETVEDFLNGKGSQGLLAKHPDQTLWERTTDTAWKLATFVPWPKWAPALANWIPLALLTFFCSICLALIVHRQWSSNEHLRYPIARIAGALIDQDEGKAFGPIYRKGIFWTGFGIVFGINVINGIYAWYPGDFIQVPLQFDFGGLLQKWPKITSVPHGWCMIWPKLFPTVVAITFFLASDVGLSLGLALILNSIVIYSLWQMGIDTSGGRVEGDVLSWQQFGSAIGILILMLYTGRHYYSNVAKGAFTGRCAKGIEPASIWAFRLLLILSAAMVFVLARMGLEWPLAVVFVLAMGFMFIIIARINVESGMFFAQMGWTPMVVMISLFGFQALGPKAILIVIIISMTLANDTRELMLPFILNGLKLCEGRKIPMGQVAKPMAPAVVLALAVAIPAVLFANYYFGKPKFDNWTTEDCPTTAFTTASKAVSDLQMEGKLDESIGYSAWQRITHAELPSRFGVSVLIGLVLAIGLSILRLRFAWWPLHPVILLMCGNWGISYIAFSFLIGWILKTLVTRLGGPETFRRAQIFMIGVIAGDLLGGLLFMGIGGGYFLLADKFPPKFTVLPA